MYLIKNFADYNYTKLPSIFHHNSYFAQKQKISGSQGKKQDFDMSMASCRMYCTIRGSLHYKNMFLFTDTPEILPFCPKSLLQYQIEGKFYIGIICKFSIHSFMFIYFHKQ